MSWKVFPCILSHVTLIKMVIAYCLMGSYAFEWLEAENERQMRIGVKYIRGNLSHGLWNYTQNVDILIEHNWTIHAGEILRKFEEDILDTMKTGGWDGIESVDRLQWTRMGALFYSIIVITTIGYGHIAPKTDAGKISTIFYAIVGIPLMLLCLSNIGDIMASSFRFIYWRVCCFVCTREPKRRPRRPDFQRSISYHQPNSRPVSQHQPTRLPNRASMRRSVRVSQRTADSGIDTFYEPRLSHAFSDTELRYTTEELGPKRHSYNRNQRFNRHRNMDRMRQERHTVERERVGDRSSKRYNTHSLDRSRRGQSQRPTRAHSAARFEENHHTARAGPELNSRDYTILPASRGRHRSRINEKRARSEAPRIIDSKYDAPVLCNKYAIDALMRRESVTDDQNHHRSKSMPRSQSFRKSIYSPSREATPEPMPKRLHPNERSRYLAPPIPPSMLPSDEECIELEVPVTPRRQRRRERTPLPPLPRIMSPMGFAVHRQARLIESFDEEAGAYDDDYIDYVSDAPVKPVPIWLCVCLVIGYIIAGAYYFHRTDNWTFLDSAYFCFITLATIGFGDFVPAQGLNQTVLSESKLFLSHNSSFLFDVTDQEIKIAGCSLYLLFGISLLAMSFNLVQEEVIANVKNVARQLGILKEEEVDF